MDFEKEMKIYKWEVKKVKTEIKKLYYIILFLTSIGFIVMQVINENCKYVTGFIAELIEIMATGMFPAVLLAFLTDIITVKHKQKEYKQKLKCKKKSLEECYTELPSEILVYINTPDYAENEESKSYVQWCKKYFTDNSVSKDKIKNYFTEFNQLWAETKNYYFYVSEYDSAAVEDIRQNELKKIKKVRDVLMSIKVISYRQTDDANFYIAKIQEFIEAVIELFDKIYDYPNIKKFYTQKYNSVDFENYESEE